MVLHSVWTWNPPGYGGSDGPASLIGYAGAAIAMAQRARTMIRNERAGSPDDPSDAQNDSEATPGQITYVLCGNSIGCCVAAHVAAHITSQGSKHERVGMVILRNPPPLSDVVMRICRRYRIGGLIRPIADSLPSAMRIADRLAHVDAPVVWIACEEDRLVPTRLQQSVFDQYRGDLHRVGLAGMDHSDVATPDQQRQISETIRRVAGGWLLD